MVPPAGMQHVPRSRYLISCEMLEVVIVSQYTTAVNVIVAGLVMQFSPIKAMSYLGGGLPAGAAESPLHNASPYRRILWTDSLRSAQGSLIIAHTLRGKP